MDARIEKLRDELDADYARRFPRSKARHEEHGTGELDQTSHAIRWNRPFARVVAKAAGSSLVDVDGLSFVDYWQGHFANILGHNPEVIRRALAQALDDGRGLQSGMVHEIESEVAELIVRCTGTETVRLTTSGTLGTFYAVLLARSFTGRDLVLKVRGGWHGSQPFGLKGVAPREGSFDHLESEGLPSGLADDVVLTRFNDVDDLRGIFERDGERIACFLVEPMLGAAGGFPAGEEYLREARHLTERHGALLLCDEIITGFRFRAGDASSLYGVRPDLLILGKIVGGGMPVAAVAGRREVLELCSRSNGRVKFEGGTYSAHELSLVAARAQIRLLMDRENEIYPRLAAVGERARQGVARVAGEEGFPVHVLGRDSIVTVHPARENTPAPGCPEELLETRHPLVEPQLLKSLLMFHDVSTHSGLGALSTEHTDGDLDRTLEGFRAALTRLKGAGIA